MSMLSVFDMDECKIKNLREEGIDFEYTSAPSDISKADFVVITVPTLIKKSNRMFWC